MGGLNTKVYGFITESSPKLEMILISINSSMNKLQYIHTTEYCKAMKTNYKTQSYR